MPEDPIIQYNVDVAWVAELVDARDLKSLGACPRESSSLSLGTNENSALGQASIYDAGFLFGLSMAKLLNFLPYYLSKKRVLTKNGGVILYFTTLSIGSLSRLW